MSLFVDTSMWYAAADHGDRNNTRAKSVLASAGESLVTTDHVLVETWSLLSRRVHRSAADAFWGGLRAGIASVEIVGEADFEAAWTIGQSFPDQDFSIVDRTSFAVMLRLGVVRAAAFDDHFAVFRYGAKRGQSFDIVR
jgi:predicted nucleic acid-binding protein